jgi:hypothetical protein
VLASLPSGREVAGSPHSGQSTNVVIMLASTGGAPFAAHHRHQPDAPTTRRPRARPCARPGPASGLVRPRVGPARLVRLHPRPRAWFGLGLGSARAGRACSVRSAFGPGLVRACLVLLLAARPSAAASGFGGRLFIPSVHFVGCPHFGMRGQQEEMAAGAAEGGNHFLLLIMAAPRSAACACAPRVLPGREDLGCRPAGAKSSRSWRVRASARARR